MKKFRMRLFLCQALLGCFLSGGTCSARVLVTGVGADKARTPHSATDVQSHSARASELFAQAECYYYGQGEENDYARAFSLYRQSAELGHPGAQSNLGEMYEQGRGVDKDYAQALKWYQLSASQGNKAAEKKLAELKRK